MKNPKISIITVCYNSEAYLEEAIQSVVNQPYENKEYVIIDGGSKDGTLEIVNKYRDKIAYVVSEPDKGISDAFNKGIKAATGDIIGICNSDDVMADDVLTKIANAWEPDIDILRLNEVTKNFTTGEEWLYKPTLIFNKMLIGCRVCHMGCFISKDAYIKFGGYDINKKSSMDVDLLRRFSYLGAKYKYVPETCGYFRKGGVSGNPHIRNIERNQIIRKYGGNSMDVIISMSYHLSKQFIKRILTTVGEDMPNKLHNLLK